MAYRIQNTKRNMVAGVFNKLVITLFPFIVRTVLIHSLGIEYVGISGLFGSILQMLSMAELGFSSAIVYSMYKPIANNDTSVICALMNFYKKVYRIVGIVIFGVGTLLLPFLDKMINGPCPEEVNLYLVYMIYLLNTSLGYFLFAYTKSLLLAYQYRSASDTVEALCKMAMSICQIIILATVHNYYIYIIMMPLWTLADNVFCAIRARKLFPEIVCKGKIEKSLRDDIIQKTKGLLIYRVCGTTRSALGNIFISSFLGLTPVGIYSNYYYIMQSIRSFMDVMTQSMSAGIGNSVAVESVEKNYRNLQMFTFLYEWICGWCTVCLLCLYQPFMRIWTGEDMMFEFPVVIAFCSYFYIWTAGDIRSQYTDATGLWLKEKNRAIIGTIATVVLNYILIQTLGVSGVIISAAVSMLFIGLPWSNRIIFTNYFKGKSCKKYMMYQGIYALFTAINCVITYMVCSVIPGDGMIALIAKGGICVVVPNICYFAMTYKMSVAKEALGFVKDKLLKGRRRS